MIDFNTEPYNDDYDENKKFYRILFRPSFAVQARELTQLQTILQKQISRHGDHVFRQGAMVVPGQISIDNNAQFVKLQPIYSGVAVETFLTNLLGKIIVGSSGLRAEVIKIQNQETSEPSTIYVRYINSGTNGITKVFANGETISTEDTVYDFQAAASAATGYGSIVTIQRGIYYVNGNFVLVDMHSIILDKYTNTPSYRVGLAVSETIITPEDEESLLDNAQNSYNFAAPGAHRFFIDLQLTKLAINSTEDKDFIELLRLNEGINQKLVTKTEYAEFEKTLARRTYDESGDYTVRDFAIDIREHRTNNRGSWVGTTTYILGDIVVNAGITYVAKNSGTSVSIAPVHSSGTAYDGPGSTGINWEYDTTPVYNRGIFLSGDESKLAVGLEPGKAYIRGYEIEKIATEYVAVDKARTYTQADNAFISATVGNFIYSTNVNNLPPVNTFATVDLYNQITNSGGRGTAVGTKVGTARVRFIDWDNGTIGSNSAVYKTSLFDVKLVNGYTFDRHVKSIYFSGGSPAASFSADVNPITTQLIGSITAAGTSVTGTGTSFQTDLIVGDYISVGGVVYRVTVITSQVALTLGATLTTTGSTYSLVKTKLYESNLDSLVFPLPYYAVKSLRSGLGSNDTSYTSYERFVGTTSSASGGFCSLTVSTSSGSMASGSVNGNYILTDNTTGNIILPSATVPSGASVTFTLVDTYASRPFIVIGAVNKTGSSNTEKTKTLNGSTTVVLTTQATATATTLSLGKSDVWRIVSVKMKSGTFSSPGPSYSIDIMDRYDFDSGQRRTYYDLGSLKLKDTFAPPSAPIEIVFEYFTHSTGDYCSVNSYPAQISYKEIPTSLRDSLDYRPKIDDTGLVFSGSGSATLIPKRGADIRTDFTYYLARKDKIAVDVNGNFFNISGTSSINPGVPEDPSIGMVLYILNLEPFTFETNSNNVEIKKIDNRRFTMRDIGKLEKRIDNLEYYTSLSLLEQETQSLKIADSSGLDRLKNGFIVDNFSGHGVGGVNSPDYKCSIDMQKGELRPFFTMKNVNLIEKNSNDSQRAASFYKQSGDVITLPILENVVLVKQDFASRLENINPFAIFTFIGDVKLNPPADEWFEVDRRPDIVTDIDGNFSTITALAEKAGVLGTVWNAWETQWAGTPVVVGVDRSVMQRGAIRIVTSETLATTIGQARTGINSTIIANVDRQVVADRVVSSAIIPYIRSRNLLIQVRGLKPSTRFYPFFDNIDVSSYCTPATKLTYTTLSGVFDFEKSVGGTATEIARRISGDSQVCLNKGDVITGATSGATAVVVGSEIDPDTGAKSLFIVNIIGTFTTNEQITGSISTATGTYTSLMPSAPGSLIGDSVVANKNGDVNLLFNIPNTDAVRFRTGSRELKLVDTSIATGNFTSRGRAQYRAEGVVETRQSLVNAVRNAEIVQEIVQDSQTIVETSSRVIGDTGWFDPLAQTFLVDNKGGAFLTKVDIFFASKDVQVPVTMEIREVVNGYPGKRVLPFSRVTLKPEQVSISVTMVDLDGVSTPSYNTPTSFEFKSPVYVQDAGEYCIVLMSDSNKYKCWVSQVGDTVPGTSRTISEQPYAGALFKSQNASTWTTDQSQDLKFTVHRARFDTSSVGTVQFVNDVLPYSALASDPFQTTSGSNIVRVWHKEHGLSSGSSVIVAGATGTLNGIPSAELNGTKTVSNIDLDSYTYITTTNATGTGYSGGNAIRAKGQVQYDAVYPIAQVQSFSETTVGYSIKTTSGKSVDGVETPFVQDIGFGDCLANENNYFYSPRVVASEVNENASMAGNKSVTFAVNMTSSNDSLSPVLDAQRMSLVAVSNKINSPTHANVDVSPVDYTTLFTGATGAFSFSGSTITSSNSTVRSLAATIAIGQYILISGATTSGNNGQFLVTSNTDDGSTVTITVSGISFTGEAAVGGTTVSTVNLFTDEISPVGSSIASKYVTNAVKLALPSTFVKIRFAANIPSGSDVDIYYKTSLGSTGTLDKTKYTLATPAIPAIKVENGNETFYDVDYSLTNLIPFDAIQVKLVMKSTNSSAIPRIRDLRIIACA